MKIAILTPAYGRDYESKLAVQTDLYNNKDFILQNISSPWSVRLCNLNDLVKTGFTHVEVRYAKLRRGLFEKIVK